jgi:RNA polymerase primary sigma factor
VHMIDRNETAANAAAFGTQGLEKSDQSPPDSPQDSVLTSYFRHMSNYHVMSPEEELECARAFVQAEVDHWVALLSYVPAADIILKRLARDMSEINEVERPDVPQIEGLQNLARSYRKQRSKLSAAQLRQYGELSAELALAVRSLDRERLWMTHAFETAKQDTTGTTGSDDKAAGLAATPAYLRYVARAQRTDLLRSEAKNRFARANLRLVVSIARRHNRGRLPLLDLIQEGNIGLIKAIDRFDATRGYRFSTYASWWIRHNISRALADTGRTVRVPVHLSEALNCISRVTMTTLARTGIEPTLDELENSTGISKHRIAQARESNAGPTLSLDRPIGDDDERRYIDLLVEPNAPSPFDKLADHAWSTELERLLGKLTPIETRIIRWRYGLDGDVELTLKDIGDKYGLSRERIRQLQEQALHKMRKQTSADWR